MTALGAGSLGSPWRESLLFVSLEGGTLEELEDWHHGGKMKKWSPWWEGSGF